MSEVLEPFESPAAAAPPSSPTGGPIRPASGRWLRSLLVSLALLALVALFWPRTEGERARRPGGFLLDDSGSPVPLERELRSATLVHFWASWCAPCVSEMPELLAYARAATSDRFQVVLVAVGDEPKAARRFLGEPQRPLYFDPNWEVANRFGTLGLPESHLVVGGEVVESFVGATRWGDPAVRVKIQKWIATPASATP